MKNGCLIDEDGISNVVLDFCLSFCLVAVKMW